MVGEGKSQVEGAGGQGAKREHLNKGLLREKVMVEAEPIEGGKEVKCTAHRKEMGRRGEGKTRASQFDSLTSLVRHREGLHVE